MRAICFTSKFRTSAPGSRLTLLEIITASLHFPRRAEINSRKRNMK